MHSLQEMTNFHSVFRKLIKTSENSSMYCSLVLLVSNNGHVLFTLDLSESLYCSLVLLFSQKCHVLFTLGTVHVQCTLNSLGCTVNCKLKLHKNGPKVKKIRKNAIFLCILFKKWPIFIHFFANWSKRVKIALCTVHLYF